MLRKLCGDNLSKVIFVTTMWDQTSTRQGEQGRWQDEWQRRQREQRERKLMDNYWRPMLDLGARTDRFLQNKEIVLGTSSKIFLCFRSKSDTAPRRDHHDGPMARFH